MRTAAAQSKGRNRCNPIDILWKYFCTAGGIYKGNLRRIERNRRLMPSRRFLAADLEAHSRCCRETDRYRRRFASFRWSPRLPRIVTFRFRELLPPVASTIAVAKDWDLRIEPYWILTRLLPNSYVSKDTDRDLSSIIIEKLYIRIN